MDTPASATSARFSAILELPPCRLAVIEAGGLIRELRYLAPHTPLQAPATPLAERVAAALQSYLDDPTSEVDLPYLGCGTPFQRAVWQHIRRIPAGSVRRYGEIAADLGGAARAVGQACGANPFPVFVPCHRVVSASGLGGFAHHSDGWLIATKRWLLHHEGVL